MRRIAELACAKFVEDKLLLVRNFGDSNLQTSINVLASNQIINNHIESKHIPNKQIGSDLIPQ